MVTHRRGRNLPDIGKKLSIIGTEGKKKQKIICRLLSVDGFAADKNWLNPMWTGIILGIIFRFSPRFIVGKEQIPLKKN